jgi:hypothetical protein
MIRLKVVRLIEATISTVYQVCAYHRNTFDTIELASRPPCEESMGTYEYTRHGLS